MEKINVGGINFDVVDFVEAGTRIEKMIRARGVHQVVMGNTDCVVRAQDDLRFRGIVNLADLVVPDGMSVVRAAKYLGSPLSERVSGLDLAFELCARGWKVFFLGASEESSKKGTENLMAKIPSLRLAGRYSPPFGQFTEEENSQIIRRVREASPDILFVCMGPGRQDIWISEHLSELGVPVCMGMGSFLDLLAGKAKRAPVWARKAGLEWLFTMFHDPKRFFKRSIQEGLKFFLVVSRQKREKKQSV